MSHSTPNAYEFKIYDIPAHILVTYFSGIQLENIVKACPKIMEKDQFNLIYEAIQNSYVKLRNWTKIQKMSGHKSDYIETSDLLQMMYKRFTNMPIEIGHLMNLRKLGVSGNRHLSSIPIEIG